MRSSILSSLLGVLLLLSAAAGATTTWNPSDKAAVVALGSWAGNSNLYAERSSSAGTYGMVRATSSGKHSGKFYLEIIPVYTYNNACGNCVLLGFANATQSLTTFVGSSSNSVAFQENGHAYVNNSDQTTTFNCNFALPGRVLGFAIDMTSNRVWCTIDGSTWSNCTGCGAGNPSSPATGIDISTVNDGVSVMPAWSGAYQGSLINGAVLNVGNYGPFILPLPSGYSGWDAGGTVLGPNLTGPGTWESAGSGAYDTSGSSMTLSGGNLTATTGGSVATSAAVGTYANDAKYTGKLYFEVNWTIATSGFNSVGIGDTMYSGNGPWHVYGAGLDPGWSAGFTSNGDGRYNGSVTYPAVGMYKCVPSPGVFEGVAVDFGAKKMWCTINGVNWENGDNPATGTGGLSFNAQVMAYGTLPIADLGSSGDAVTLNLGASPFHFPCPSGFTGWDAPCTTLGGGQLQFQTPIRYEGEKMRTWQ